jgi:6-phosphofructokinase 1
VTLDGLCDILLGAILKRRSLGSPFGVAVLAEGLLETVGEEGLLQAMGSEEGLRRYGQVQRDEHHHLRLGEIEFGRLVKDHLARRMAAHGIQLPLTLVDKDLGYELRCADPIPFDAEYTRDLGYAAVKFLRSPDAGRFGAIISVLSGRLEALPFEELIVPQTGRMRPRKVNVEGEAYECARRYMIRLEREDFTDPERLAALAEAAGLSPEQFRERFGHVPDLGGPHEPG